MRYLSKTKIAFVNRAFVSKLKRKVFSRVWLVRTFIAALVLFALFLSFTVIFLLFKNTQLGKLINLATAFAKPDGNINIINNRVNILILGRGGENHEAPDLTDTMIITSLDIANDDIYITGLPRDIWIENLKTKINTLYYYGNQKEKNGGLVLSKNITSELVGFPIQYALVIDFAGLEKIIESLGGIEIDIAESFTDDRFPITGKENDDCNGDKTFFCRYETITFSKGRVLMDGVTALKYARSRYSQGEEGNDFSRSRRQQDIMVAIKQKLLSKEILLHPGKIKNILNTMNSNAERDFDDLTAAAIFRFLFNGRNKITYFQLSFDKFDVESNNPIYDNQFVLLPKDKDLISFQKYLQCGLGMCD